MSKRETEKERKEDDKEEEGEEQQQQPTIFNKAELAISVGSGNTPEFDHFYKQLVFPDKRHFLSGLDFKNYISQIYCFFLFFFFFGGKQKR